MYNTEKLIGDEMSDRFMCLQKLLVLDVFLCVELNKYTGPWSPKPKSFSAYSCYATINKTSTHLFCKKGAVEFVQDNDFPLNIPFQVTRLRFIRLDFFKSV